jgi:peptidoglycan/LPS O-acetylase OafA/YrhL
VTASTTSAYRGDVQGLRALAVLMVVGFHAGLPMPGGFAGVDVFFVISGFVITGLLLREQAGEGRIDLRRFYTRRFLRLTPALVVMVVVTILVASLLLSPLGPQDVTYNTALGALLLFANYAAARYTGDYFDVAADLNPLLHTWTLSLEEQFYLVFPVLLVLGFWLAARRRGRWVGGLVAALAVASFVVALVGWAGIVIPVIPEGFLGFYGPLGRAWEFAAGALLALAIPALRPLSRAVATLLTLAGIAAIVATVFLVSGELGFPGPATLAPVLGTVLVIWGGTTANRASEVLALRPARALGDLSYSWYLWHWPVIVFAGVLWPAQPLAIVAAAGLSLIPAVVSYRWIEQPLRSRRPSAKHVVRLVAAFMVPALALTGAALALSSVGYGIPAVATAREASGRHIGNLSGCMSWKAIDAADAARCTWNADAPGDPVYLVGDSIAEHYSEGLIAAGLETGRPVTVLVAAGCPIYPVVIENDGQVLDITADVRCNDYAQSALAWLDDQRPGLVLVGESDSAAWNPSPLIPPMYGYPFADDAAKSAAIETGLQGVVDRMQAAGHTVTLAMAPPSYRFPAPAWEPQRCFLIEVIEDACRASRTVDDLDALQGPLRDIIFRVADRSDAAVFDLRDRYCPDGVCSTHLDGQRVYLDAIHLSAAESAALTPRFVELLTTEGLTTPLQ